MIAQLRKEKAIVPGLKALWRLNQADGFTGPACAMPEPGDRQVIEYCENGAKAVAAETTKKRVTPEFFAQHPIAELEQKSDYWLEEQGRLTHPMVRRKGATHYEAISW